MNYSIKYYLEGTECTLVILLGVEQLVILYNNIDMNLLYTFIDIYTKYKLFFNKIARQRNHTSLVLMTETGISIINKR